MKRIKIIDGFRTIAVLGVLWAHIWMFAGTPPGRFMGIEFARLISFFGTGVDLFFVIRGFCMYLMYVSKQTAFSFSNYTDYLKKRWLRIAPAFYAAIIVYGLISVKFDFLLFDWLYALKHALFIKNLFSDLTLYAPHFWSLCTEWHFYLVLPVIVYGIHRFSFYRTIIVLGIGCLLFRYLIWLPNHDPHNIINYSIANRLIEFLTGIVAARIYLDNRKEWIFHSLFGLFLGVVIAFSGRILMSAGLQERADLAGSIARTMNLPLLATGYALVIVNTLQYKTLFSTFLESNVLTSIGKYSYSMYLWHWIVAETLTKFALDNWHVNTFLTVNLVFIISLAVLYPLSKLSYYLFESFYFKKRKPAVKISVSGGNG